MRTQGTVVGRVLQWAEAPGVQATLALAVGVGAQHRGIMRCLPRQGADALPWGPNGRKDRGPGPRSRLRLRRRGMAPPAGRTRNGGPGGGHRITG